MRYTPQHPTENLPIREEVANARLNLAHLNQIDEVAKHAGVLLHRSFNVPVADGNAHYQITRVKSKTVVVTLCGGICLDDYCDMVLGEECEIPIRKAEELVGRKDSLTRIFG